MSSNKAIRQRLEQIYGKGCMFQKARIAARIEKMGGIKTYKKYIEEKHYTGKIIKKLEETMTLHHLHHRFNGGKTTVENGAIVNALAHQYMHSLPRQHEEVINNMLREFKLNYIAGEEHGSIDLVLGDDYIEIPLEKQTKKKYNRAKEKRNLNKRIEEELEGR